MNLIEKAFRDGYFLGLGEKDNIDEDWEEWKELNSNDELQSCSFPDYTQGGQQDGVGEYIVQYQFFQENRWYDHPCFERSDNKELLKRELRISKEIQEAVKQRTRHRIIQRKVCDVRVE